MSITRKNKSKILEKELNKDIECFYCHKIGHSISECTLRLKRKAKKACNYACRYCHKDDHFISDCPEISKKKEKESTKNTEKNHDNKENHDNEKNHDNKENHANEMFIKFGPTWYILVDETEDDCDIAKKNRYDLCKLVEENNKELDDRITNYFNTINSMDVTQEKVYQEFWEKQCDKEMDEYMEYSENTEFILRREYELNGWKWNEWSMIV